MKIHANVIQGSDDWMALRLGIPTASSFAKILTAGGKRSSQQEDYLNALLAERMVGAPADDPTSWMQRGSRIEDEARAWYTFQTGLEVQRVGFIEDEFGGLQGRGRFGCSPDGLIGDEGMLELKCPSAKVHVGYLRGDIRTVYRPQLQGQLYVAERRWVDTVSYCPGFPPPLDAVRMRTEIDDEYVAELDRELGVFCAWLESEWVKLSERIAMERAS